MRPLIFLSEHLRPLKKHSGWVFPNHNFHPLTLLHLIQRFYVASSRQLKRMESVRRSPIFNHFLESIQGASTIRAFGYQQQFVGDNAIKVDFNQVAHYASFSSNRWFYDLSCYSPDRNSRGDVIRRGIYLEKKSELGHELHEMKELENFSWEVKNIFQEF